MTSADNLRFLKLAPKAEEPGFLRPMELRYCAACAAVLRGDGTAFIESKLEEAIHAEELSTEKKLMWAEIWLTLLFEERAGLCGERECSQNAVGAFAVILGAKRLAEARHG